MSRTQLSTPNTVLMPKRASSLTLYIIASVAPPPSMVVPESTDARFRRDLQQLLTQFAERSRAAAVGAPGQRSTPLATDEGGAQEGVGMFTQPVSQRPGVAGTLTSLQC